MVSKEYVKSLLLQMSNYENEITVNGYISRIDSISDNEWNSFVKENNITEENIYDYLKNRIKPFIELNDLISYGTTDNTLHLHVVPKDVRSMLNRNGKDIANQKLIDALMKIREFLNSDENMQEISSIFAVSPILVIRPLQDIFEKLGFEVSKTDSTELLSKFPNAKSVWQAYLPKEKLLSDEWLNEIQNLQGNECR